MSDAYDVFLCHTPSDTLPARQLAAALAGLGVACALAADTAHAAHETELPPELARAKALLAWCSEDFFHDRACQACLAATVIADRPRVLLLNPEPGLKHIYPPALREAWRAEIPDTSGFPALAERIRARCAALTGTLGGLGIAAAPPWHTALGGNPPPAPRFERRERELWDIHAALRPEPGPPPDGTEPPVVVVSGQPGQGKSLLAREYAFRFGAAYPGGVFWLAGGEARPVSSVAELAENPALKPQLADLWRQLAPEAEPGAATTVPALLEKLGAVPALAGQPYLWIVDDLPPGLNGPAFQQWLAPTAQGRSLVTTHAQDYDDKAEAIHLPPLDADAARRLLIRDIPPTSDAERIHAANLLAALDRHTLALALANAALRADRRHRHAPYDALRRTLQDPYREASAIAKPLGGTLPKGQDTGLAAILLAGICLLDEAGRDLLRLAALLSDAPLPVDFIAACLAASGLCAEPPPQYPQLARLAFWRRPAPAASVVAGQRVAAGIARLEWLALGERRQDWLYILPWAARIIGYADRDRARPTALRRAATQVLLERGEHCAAGQRWEPLAPLAAHARVLAAELREPRADDTPPLLAQRARLAMLLGEMDLAAGIHPRALSSYQDAAAGLARLAKAAPDQAREARRQLAQCRERIGDILAARGDATAALENYRKSLALRERLAAQDPDGTAPHAALVASYAKLGQTSERLADPVAALAYYHKARERAAATPDATGLTGEWAWVAERIASLEAPPPAPEPIPESALESMEETPAPPANEPVPPT